MTMREKQIVARAIGIKKNGGNHAFFRDIYKLYFGTKILTEKKRIRLHVLTKAIITTTFNVF